MTTTITNVAQRILDENGYSTSDISLVNLEYLMDNAIDYVNLHAGTTIAHLTGSAGAKSLVGTDNEIVVVKDRTLQKLKERLDKSPNVTSGPFGTQTVRDAQVDELTESVKKGIQRLKILNQEPPIYVTNDPVPTSE